jgi:carbon monoxide dehydrogenase subunit G
MAVRIGPVNARFKGKLQLSDIVPMASYRINFDGQGGVAGFGKGHADVPLGPDGGDGAATRLNYRADAQVGGKIAQIGSRLVESAAAKIAADFFKAFEARMGEESGNGGAAGGSSAGVAGGSGAGQAGNAAAGTAGKGPAPGVNSERSIAAVAAATGVAAAGNAAGGAAIAAIPASPGPAGGARGTWWWIAGIIVLVLIAWLAFG